MHFFISRSSCLLLLFSSILWIGSTSAFATSSPSGSICKAGLFTTLTPTQAGQEHSSGRRWQNRRKRQTFLPSPVRQITPQEEAALLDQLGYVPPNLCTISARSGSVDNSVDEKNIDMSSKGIGRPIAIRSYPLLVQVLNNKEEDKRNYSHTPFPTMYWLTCPHVSRAISEIERNGYVRKFQLRLEDDSSLAKEWWQCHENYAAERWELLSESDREYLLLSNNQLGNEENSPEQRKVESMRKMIQYSGVAGTDHRRLRETDDDSNNSNSNKDASLYVPSVKCLHSHYAHYRSQKESDNAVINIVGKWTHELLLEDFPELII
jgi:hypothetical protein